MSHIFISYSTLNREYARILADKLRDEGFDVWIDNHRLHSSEDWWRSIVLALRDCAAFLVILTPEADESRWVQREITLAEKYSKPVYPLLLDGDLNTPNWEIFVRTQVENVVGGKLPTKVFYDYLAQHAPRKERQGTDVTTTALQSPSAINDSELANEIANPPSPEIATIPVVSARKPTIFGITSISFVNFFIAGFLILIAFVVAISFNAWNRPTATLTPTQQIAENSTETRVPTLATPSITPSPIPTLSSTEIEGTIQGGMNLAQPDIANTQSAAMVLVTANAIATDTRNSADQIATSTQWTLTPTIDTRTTIFAGLTQTQQIATQLALDLTSFAVQRTPIQNETGVTYSPSITMTSQPPTQVLSPIPETNTNGCTLPSRLSIGVEGYVNSNLIPRMKSDPELSGNNLGGLEFGTEFQVIEGPVCADKLNWWKVRLKIGSTGWVAEGNNYYLIAPFKLDQASLRQKYDGTCPHALTPLLKIGGKGRTNRDNLFLYRDVDRQSAITNNLPSNTLVEILGGPACDGEANNTLFWYIRVAEGEWSGHEGWISEGNTVKRYVDAVNNE